MTPEITDTQKTEQARAIANALGQDWALVELGDGSYPTRAIVHVRDEYGCVLRWDRGRLQISGRWPKTKGGTIETPYHGAPSITVNAERSPREIAGAIVGRFLPAYGPLYAEQRRKVEHADARTEQNDQTSAQIIAAGLGRKAQQGEGVYLHHNHVYQVRPEGGSMRFEAFSVPVAIGLQILELTRQYKCETCSAEISRAQAGLSMARKDGAPPRCKDCITAELTQALISDAAEAVETIDPDELERFAAEQRRKA